MRILTVRQPWAWAIIHGGKDIENRVRNIAGDYRGPVAIHVGLEYDTAWSSPILYDTMHQTGVHRHPGVYPWHESRGAIIGVVDLVAVHGVDEVGCMAAIPDCSPWAEKTPGRYHLRLANPRSLDEPIAYTGALGLRRLDDHVAARILAAIA